jgi:hypothetical protein
MSRLRVVDTAAPTGDVAMADAIRALAERICAEQPIVVMVAWETADAKLHIAALPNSVQLKRGMADSIYDATHPEFFEVETP